MRDSQPAVRPTSNRYMGLVYHHTIIILDRLSPSKHTHVILINISPQHYNFPFYLTYNKGISVL